MEGSRKAAIRNFVKTKNCRRQVLLDSLGAEQAVCSGCDICDNKKRNNIHECCKNDKILSTFRIPGDELPDLESDVFKEIKVHNKYFTKETLEERYLKKVNKYSRKFLGINIWWHNSFEEIIDSLLFKNKIRILKRFWKGKLSVNKSNF